MRMNAAKPIRPKQPGRRPTNVSLPDQLIQDAKRLGINISQACEGGLASEVKRINQERWIEENWDTIQSSNAYVEKHGLPLARYRQF